MDRLLLFDIDGTLTWGGPAKGAFALAMRSVFGTAGKIDGHDFSGKTDPQIATELLMEEGLSEAEIERGMEPLWVEYLRELESRLPERPMTVLPGVPALLEHLSAMDGLALGLLTGNIIEGARLKLGSVGLMDYFPVGGFGSDSAIREDLPSVAMERATANWGVEFLPEAVVVIGDTPRDVACGKHEGTRTVGVATGRFDVEALRATGADQVLQDMSNLSEAVDSILG
jgi:phosphoglycolate phosphatase-like HAD superfamily hydrolase